MDLPRLIDICVFSTAADINTEKRRKEIRRNAASRAGQEAGRGLLADQGLWRPNTSIQGMTSPATQKNDAERRAAS
jgi:hypothetical protein